VVDVNRLMERLEQRINQRRLYTYQPYPWQEEFHNAGATYLERMLMAANRVGKTLCAGVEVSYHLTGEYPKWWKGKKFTKGIIAWVGSDTNESSRNIVQAELFGGTTKETFGTGWVPADRIEGNPKMKVAGVSDVIDYVHVRHKSGTISTVYFKTYDQGWKRWQGAKIDVAWLDEEPDDEKIFTEAQTRLMTKKGIMILTATPLRGQTTIVQHFLKGKNDVYVKNATWDDAPHLSPEVKESLLSRYADYQRDARSKGIPMLGEGAVFKTPEEDIKIPPFPIPAHFARIAGIDFGIDHPTAVVWLAYDRDEDIVYLCDGYKQSDQLPIYHAAIIKTRPTWIPVSWPNDGHQRGKGTNVQLYRDYLDKGVNLLSRSARYENDKGGPQPLEPVISDIQERCMTGRFKVFSTVNNWLEEYRNYHREDGKLVKKMDDMLSATFYAMMMLRYAVTRIETHSPNTTSTGRAMA